MLRSEVLRAGLLALVMASASAAAVWMTPTQYMADKYPREKLAQVVPRAFGEWTVDSSIVPVPPSPDMQKVLDETYDETLALTYRNRAGQRVMLSLAYGRNQHKGMNTHRPEVCYPAQGFRLVSGSQSTAQIALGQRQLPVNRVVAVMGARNEPITYWLLVGDSITSFGYPQRAVAMRYGLKGEIPDGVLVRISSIDSNSAQAFEVQRRFIVDMLGAVQPSRLPRLLGAT
jgi:EpsI family protein